MSLTALVCALMVQAQIVDPVHFTSDLRMLDGDKGEIVFSATIDSGWHVYSTDLTDGPIAATFNQVKMEGVELVGKLQPRGKEVKQFDKMFDMELRYFEHKATFVQRVRFTQPKYVIDCYLEYGACNDEMCMPPSQVELRRQGEWKGAEKAAATVVEEHAEAETKDTASLTADTLQADTAQVAALPAPPTASASARTRRCTYTGPCFAFGWNICLLEDGSDGF